MEPLLKASCTSRLATASARVAAPGTLDSPPWPQSRGSSSSPGLWLAVGLHCLAPAGGWPQSQQRSRLPAGCCRGAAAPPTANRQPIWATQSRTQRCSVPKVSQAGSVTRRQSGGCMMGWSGMGGGRGGDGAGWGLPVATAWAWAHSSGAPITSKIPSDASTRKRSPVQQREGDRHPHVRRGLASEWAAPRSMSTQEYEQGQLLCDVMSAPGTGTYTGRECSSKLPFKASCPSPSPRQGCSPADSWTGPWTSGTATSPLLRYLWSPNARDSSRSPSSRATRPPVDTAAYGHLHSAVFASCGMPTRLPPGC